MKLVVSEATFGAVSLDPEDRFTLWEKWVNPRLSRERPMKPTRRMRKITTEEFMIVKLPIHLSQSGKRGSLSFDTVTG